MDTTFISIHDLSYDARLLYVSNSIADILGYSPEDVVGKSCWEYFHPDEVPFARAIHGRGVELDKAAVLNYCRIKNKSGTWVGCECVFTIVHDVLVGCTSVYRVDGGSQRRANDAPIIRQLFSSSPKDPRYHMLSYISAKFSQGPKPHIHEPRAALFVNRFTRTLTIMYATNGLENLLDISAHELVGKSFYYCIQESCLSEAVRCLESAKANDSIAYLRFWYRDPRQQYIGGEDQSMSDAASSDQDSEDGGVRLNADNEIDASDTHAMSSASSERLSARRGAGRRLPPTAAETSSGTESGSIDDISGPNTSWQQSSASSVTGPDSAMHGLRPDQEPPASQLELEAVISCTSDGLVVIIREARPLVIDSLRQPAKVPRPNYADGYFASPWGQVPIVPAAAAAGQSLSEKAPGYFSPPPRILESPRQGPTPEAFWQTIRECAVFAWGITGINGSLAQYSRGSPITGAQPSGGLPVWNRDADEMGANMHIKMEDRMEE